jgi:hypothetical protein
LRERRLRDAKARGRAAEVQLLEDSEEVTQVPQLDGDRCPAARFGPWSGGGCVSSLCPQLCAQLRAETASRCLS